MTVTSHITHPPILVTGGTGKTGRRIVEKLQAKGVPVRIGSRSASPSFDWKDRAGWAAALQDVKQVYLCYAPDVAVPGAYEDLEAFLAQAKGAGVEQLVMLSGRGEEEAQRCEKLVAASGLRWTVVRASWFAQNFSEGAFLEMVMAGAITLPAGQVPEPFIDINDIADVAVAALTEPGHDGELYEVTGPRLLTFEEVAREISDAAGREIPYIDIPHETFMDAIRASGADDLMVWLLDYLMRIGLDGRNASLADGVERALGRPAADFRDYTRRIAARGTWEFVEQQEVA